MSQFPVRYFSNLFKTFCNFTISVILSGPLLNKFNDNFNEIAPICFFYGAGRNTKKTKMMSEVLRKSFLPHETIDDRSSDGLNFLLSDGLIGYPVHKFVHLVTNYTDVYYYKIPGKTYAI